MAYIVMACIVVACIVMAHSDEPDESLARGQETYGVEAAPDDLSFQHDEYRLCHNYHAMTNMP